MPRSVVAGNWKMHKTAAETRAFFEAFLPLVESIPAEIEIVVAPPFTALSAARDALRGNRRVALGAQNVHWEPRGAYTGEISVSMLAEFDVRYTIVGHSERRAYDNERDRTVNLKVKTLLAHGITPIVAVGETLEERDDGRTDARVVSQTRAAFEDVSESDAARAIVAYEPIWAIGTGKNCDPSEADRVMAVIRASVSGLHDAPILYGGSMKPDNVRTYRAQRNVNGGLVGGASLDPHAFVALIEAAVRD